MKYVLLFLLSFTLLGLEQQAGTIKYVSGKVYRVTSNGRDESLSKGDSVYSGDLISTKKGKIKIKFNDNTLMTLLSKTKLSIKKFTVDNSKSKRIAMLKLLTGGIKVNIDKTYGNNLFEISAGYVLLEIKGTSFYLMNDSNNVKVVLTEGSLAIKSALDKFNKLKLSQNKVLTVKGEELPKILGVDMSILRNMENKFKIFKVQESKTSNKFKSFNEGKVSSHASKYISSMRSILSNAYIVLKRVRKEKVIVKLNCVNNSVMTIKGHLRRSEDNKTSIDEALAKNDIKTSRNLLAKIYSSFNEVKQAEIAMKSCDSDVIELQGNKNITLDIEEVIVENDYIEIKDRPTDISFNKEKETKVQLEPIQASPYF